MYVFYVQGGGLGHLTRVDKLINTLRISKKSVLIITPSVFTNYFKDYQFVLLSWTATRSNWIKKIHAVIQTNPITAFYVDTFPLGIKGELYSIYNAFPGLNYIYISRILKWETYIKTMPNLINIVFYETIILETLYDSHLNWITNNSKNSTYLSLKTTKTPSVSFTKQPYVMIVHSGGKADVLKIYKQVIKNHEARTNLQILVFTQVDVSIKKDNVSIYKNKFPVAQYYEHAEKIYTAAGFNSIQELQYLQDKHIAIPLNKLFDDQFFRISKKQ